MPRELRAKPNPDAPWFLFLTRTDGAVDGYGFGSERAARAGAVAYMRDDKNNVVAVEVNSSPLPRLWDAEDDVSLSGELDRMRHGE